MSEPLHPGPWLASPRLALREFRDDDLQDVVRMHSEPRLRCQLLDDHALDQAFVAWRFLLNIQQRYRQHEGLGIWHAATPQPGAAPRFIGWFNLMPLPGRGEDAVELGSRLLPAAWGGGLAMEGGELLLDHGFGTLGLDRIWGTCDPANRPARACLAALGFTEHERADYGGRTGLYASVRRTHWQAWRLHPRRLRLRLALAGLEATA